MLIVLAVLGVLVTIVVLNVVGLMGRGEKESYEGDEKSIQAATSTFYADIHGYAQAEGWNEAGNWSEFHTWPTASGRYSSLDLGNVANVNGRTVYIVMDNSSNPPTQANDDAIKAAAIWMGLLSNGPGYGAPGPDVAPGDTNSPLVGENGPYLHPLPGSCSEINLSRGRGSYTWIVGSFGKVYGVFKQGGVWYKGFNGRYP